MSQLDLFKRDIYDDISLLSRNKYKKVGISSERSQAKLK